MRPNSPETLFQPTSEDLEQSQIVMADLAIEATTSPEAPRSPLAEYVLNVMPSDLAALREASSDFTYADLVRKHTAILDHYSSMIANNTDPIAAQEIQLDLAFMRGCYLHPGAKDADHPDVTLPAGLNTMLDFNANLYGLPRVMDYELIINVNSREYERTGRMRTYLDGEAGLSERDFYYGHHLAEPHATAAAFEVESVVADPTNPDRNDVLKSAAENTSTLVKYMQAYLRLPVDHFTMLRPYLSSYPDGTRNASGAFLPAVQLIELGLHHPTAMHNQFLDESTRYMPRWSRPLVEQARARSTAGGNVDDLRDAEALKLDDDGVAAYQKIVQNLFIFRNTHRTATERQIPEAFETKTRGPLPTGKGQLREFGEPPIMEDGESGTAGFNVRNLLVGSASRLMPLLDKIKAERSQQDER